MRYSAAFIFAFILSLPLIMPKPALAADASGVWLTKQEDGNRSARIKVANCGSSLCNSIIWVSHPFDSKGRPLRDIRNKNPKLRRRPIVGLTVLLNMRKAGRNKWSGYVYSPERGQVFKGTVTLVSRNKLKVTGCKKVMFVPVCKSRYWRRVK